MRHAPARTVRACILRKLCPLSHVTFEAPLRTSHFSLHPSHSTLHISHSTLHTSHCTLRTPHFTSHCTLKTPHFTLHTYACSRGTKQPWRSHSNAICKHKFKKRIELRTQEQPLVAEHRGGTKRPQPHPPHTRGTFHRRPQPLDTEKHKVSCSGFLPKT